MNLSFEEYQKRAASTAKYPALIVMQDDNLNLGDANHSDTVTRWIYPALGLCGESGEVAEKIKKLVRDKHGIVTDEDCKAIAKELGDCLWYLAALCKEFNLDMGEVAQGNLDKLAARNAAGTLGGSGDNR